METTLPTQIELSVVTPDREIVRDSVSSVTVPGKGGYLGILPGHAPLLSELQTGELFYTRAGFSRYLAVSRGFAEVLPERVIVLAQTAEPGEAIDVERATEAKQRAEERLKNVSDPQIDMERARASLERALTRLQVAGRLRS